MKKAHYDGREAQLTPDRLPIKGNTMPNIDRLVIRATDSDKFNLATIAGALRGDARPFVSKADVVRHCLAVVAASVARDAKPGR